MKSYYTTLEARLVGHVAAKLGAAVTFARWEEDRRTGAQIPVFNVPQAHAQQARDLGLTVA